MFTGAYEGTNLSRSALMRVIAQHVIVEKLVDTNFEKSFPEWGHLQCQMWAKWGPNEG